MSPGSENAEEQRLYSKAVIEWKAGNYEEARDLIRSVFESLQPENPLFEQSRLLLNRCSDALYTGRGITGSLIEYKVVRGDSLSRIASKYGTSVAAIQKANGMAPNDTRLQIGEMLRVYSSDWSARISKGSGLLYILDTGSIFKIYPVETGSMISDEVTGIYKITEKEKNPSWKDGRRTSAAGSGNYVLGSRWIGLEPVNGGSSVGTGIHGSGASPVGTGMLDTAEGFFRMSNDDVEDVYSILPKGTQVEITD